MTEYICPHPIQCLFDEEETAAEARKQADEWTAGLELQEGDMVWLPWAGWCVRGALVH